MEIDELLCKFQGLHWHEGITYPDGAQSLYKCSCMEHQSIDPLSSLNPDFSSDHTAMELLRWFVKETWKMKYSMFIEFHEWAEFNYGQTMYRIDFDIWFFFTMNEKQPKYFNWVVLLAEWLRLEETREKWGWEECPNCGGLGCFDSNGDCTPSGGGDLWCCDKCEGLGKIRAEWAREGE